MQSVACVTGNAWRGLKKLGLGCLTELELIMWWSYVNLLNWDEVEFDLTGHEPLNWPGQITRSKISKRLFLKGISNSFHRATRYGLKPLQFFSFKIISTNMVSRGFKALAKMGWCWQANWAMDKILASNYYKLMLVNFGKFQQDSSKHFWIIQETWLIPTGCGPNWNCKISLSEIIRNWFELSC